MAVDSISGSGSSSALSNSRATIADNFDTFLSILTTQLKNQNPLDPLDTNQFTSQLVQFTGVEQQLKTNEFLQALMLANQNSSDSQAVGYIGKVVTSTGVKADLSGGKATWTFTSAAAAPNSVITVKDATGNVVYTTKGALPAGGGQFVWDGIDQDGNAYRDGTYSITIDGRDADAKYVPVTTSSSGTVSAVDLSGDEPVLTVGSALVKLSDILSVRAPS